MLDPEHDRRSPGKDVHPHRAGVGMFQNVGQCFLGNALLDCLQAPECLGCLVSQKPGGNQVRSQTIMDLLHPEQAFRRGGLLDYNGAFPR